MNKSEPGKSFCADCDLAVELCGFGADVCNSRETAQGIANIETARLIMADQLKSLLQEGPAAAEER